MSRVMHLVPCFCYCGEVFRALCKGAGRAHVRCPRCGRRFEIGYCLPTLEWIRRGRF